MPPSALCAPSSHALLLTDTPVIPQTCYAGVARDFSALAPDAFWREMAAARCLWPHRHDGSPVPPEEVSSLLPNTVAGALR